jgi:hypothetical protein
MDEILKKLLQSELLSEETKAEISEQWTASVEAFKTQVREEEAGKVRLELAEQWASERDELVTQIDSFVAEALIREMAELRGDIDRFRDLEAEYAEKLVEEKHQMAEQVATELDELVDKIDAFFEMRLSAELDELKEDLEVVKQNEFGRRMFEAFVDTYNSSYVDEDAVQSKLAMTEAKLADAKRALAEREETVNKMVREATMERVLAPLTGKKREQMAMVLRNVETSRLEESYKYFIGRVLKEDEAAPAARLTESKTTTTTTVVTGEKSETLVESAQGQKAQELAAIRRLAGISQ